MTAAEEALLLLRELAGLCGLLLELLGGARSLYLIDASALCGLPLPLAAGKGGRDGVACFMILGRDFRGSMWTCKKLIAC